MLRVIVFSPVLGVSLALSGCVLSDFKKGEELPSEGGRGGDSSGAIGGGVFGGGGGSGPTQPDGGNGTPPAGLCFGVACETPPQNTCTDATHLTAYDKVGTCSEGECQYASRAIQCDCDGDMCQSDPCANVSCNTPPATSCADINTERVYSRDGTCSGGSCDYAPSERACESGYRCADTSCQLCQSDDACAPDCTPCGGTKPYCNGFRCVECLKDSDCDGPWTCENGSCQGDPNCYPRTPALLQCGFEKTTTCCEFNAVSSGSIQRSGTHPADISAFRLDTYEVTVGRFRQFVGSFESIDIPPGVGFGANRNNAGDYGWLTAYEEALPKTRTDLIKSLKCDPPNNYTWTDDEGANETKPINCVNWATAYLFCVWAGGRLPTEAEWNLAAAGEEGRQYPWGPESPDPGRAAYDGNYSALGGVLDIAPAGSFDTTLFFLADLAGNVAEWTVDAYMDPYPVPCEDCAPISGTASGEKVVRGGSWNGPESQLQTAYRGRAEAETRSSSIGFRCANDN